MSNFVVIQTHASALIQCACGEYLSLSEDRTVEKCEGCPAKYSLSVKVVEVSPETEPVAELATV
jgi:hypothetical protein